MHESNRLRQIQKRRPRHGECVVSGPEVAVVEVIFSASYYLFTFKSIKKAVLLPR